MKRMKGSHDPVRVKRHPTDETTVSLWRDHLWEYFEWILHMLYAHSSIHLNHTLLFVYVHLFWYLLLFGLILKVAKRFRVDFPQQEHVAKASFSEIRRRTNLTKRLVNISICNNNFNLSFFLCTLIYVLSVACCVYMLCMFFQIWWT